VGIAGESDDDHGLAPHLALEVTMRGNTDGVVKMGLAVLIQGTFAVGAHRTSAREGDAGLRAFVRIGTRGLRAANGGGRRLQEPDVGGRQLHNIDARAVAHQEAEVRVAHNVFKEEG
jgi:hypothetical protein